MKIGVPKEIKNHEYRVGLTPPSVAELVSAGHEVVVETQAGAGIDFEDASQRGVVGRLPGLGFDEVDMPGTGDGKRGRHRLQTCFKPFAAERRQGLLALEDDHVRGNRISGPAIVANGRARCPNRAYARGMFAQRLPPAASPSRRCSASSSWSGGM